MATQLGDITVGELVTGNPARSRVFEALGIDYCCGGKRPLQEVCDAKGLDITEVRARLEAVEADPDAVHVEAMGLGELADHIESTHHAYLREELPRLMKMTRRVAKVHGESDARLGELERVFAGFEDELYEHMMKEEQILFPAIRQMEVSNALPQLPFGSIANPIRAMEAEHDNAGSALEQLSALTDGYTPPDWACNTYRALLDGLHELEQDMHQHVHSENNVLFPRAIELESRLSH